MGGHDAGAQHNYTGLAKYFNSTTIIGRRNVSCTWTIDELHFLIPQLNFEDI